MRLLLATIALLLASAAPSVHFSPHGGCTAVLVNAIDQAKQEIRVQAYSFTSVPIAQALIRAKRRKINVAVILDRSQPSARNTQLGELLKARIPTSIDGIHPIAHNKLTMIDGVRVCTGSFNYTNAAEYNAENLLIIDDEKLATQYLANWANHWQHSVQVMAK